MRLEYSTPALDALKDIYDFLRPKNERAAAIIQHKIIDSVERLKAMPYMAQKELLLSDEPESYRSLVIYRRYKAIYYIENETVWIVDFWDCRRDPFELIRLFRTKR